MSGQNDINPIIKAVKTISKRARAKRAKISSDSFHLDEHTKILDLGSEDGANMFSVLNRTNVMPENVYIADINKEKISAGSRKYGFIPVELSESEQLPFEDLFFDIVYCSSVIEHATVPKEQIWTLRSGGCFEKEALESQERFVNEIKRVGRQFFVQTPYKYFPMESHSLMPFFGWLPRRWLIPSLRLTNSFWIKETQPDWYLLNKKQMGDLFPGAQIRTEKYFGMTKSLMAVSSVKGK